jgi:hypothetical protein
MEYVLNHLTFDIQHMSDTISTEAILLPTKRGRGRPSNAQRAARERMALQSAQKTNETYEQRVTRISERFDIMHKLTRAMIHQQIMSFIVSGAPGVGKSYTIEGIMNAAAEEGRIKYTSIRGAQITGIQLYKTLYEHCADTDVVLMDDSDSIYEDELCLNILKAALESHKTRKLSYLSETPLLGDVPNSFIYAGRLVFITNKDFQTAVDNGIGKHVPHMSALMSRSNYLDLKLHSHEDLVAWVIYMCSKYHIPTQFGASPDQEKKALAWFEANAPKLRECSIRTVEKLTMYMVADAADWEKMARILLLR